MRGGSANDFLINRTYRGHFRVKAWKTRLKENVLFIEFLII